MDWLGLDWNGLAVGWARAQGPGPGGRAPAKEFNFWKWNLLKWKGIKFWGKQLVQAEFDQADLKCPTTAISQRF